MPWIACDVDFPFEPKTLDLADLMGWEPYEAAGRLLVFWGWCLRYASDGDLSGLPHTRIAQGIGLPAVEGDRLVEALVKSGWLDDRPYLRLHDWWSLVGLFLRGRYQREPKRWQRVQKLYASRGKSAKGGRHTGSVAGAAPEQSPTCSGVAPDQNASGSGAAPDQNTRGSGVPPDQIRSRSGADPEQNMSRSGPAPEQKTSCSEPAPEQESPGCRAALERLYTTEQNKTEHNSTEPSPPPPRRLKSGEGGVDFKKAKADLKALKLEIARRSVIRKFSPLEEQRLTELLACHGEEAIEACRALHGGVKNVPAYLSVVLGGKDDTADLIREARAILRKEAGT